MKVHGIRRRKLKRGCKNVVRTTRQAIRHHCRSIRWKRLGARCATRIFFSEFFTILKAQLRLKRPAYIFISLLLKEGKGEGEGLHSSEPVYESGNTARDRTFSRSSQQPAWPGALASTYCEVVATTPSRPLSSLATTISPRSLLLYRPQYSQLRIICAMCLAAYRYSMCNSIGKLRDFFCLNFQQRQLVGSRFYPPVQDNPADSNTS
jgi:hypothetical protein